MHSQRVMQLLKLWIYNYSLHVVLDQETDTELLDFATFMPISIQNFMHAICPRICMELWNCLVCYTLFLSTAKLNTDNCTFIQTLWKCNDFCIFSSLHISLQGTNELHNSWERSKLYLFDDKRKKLGSSKISGEKLLHKRMPNQNPCVFSSKRHHLCIDLCFGPGLYFSPVSTL